MARFSATAVLLSLAVLVQTASAAITDPPIDKSLQVELEIENLEDGSSGTVVVQLVRKWAPHGVERLKTLLKDHFYDGTMFYGNAKKDGYAQFGLHSCGLLANGKYSRAAEGPCLVPVPGDHPRPHIPNVEGTLIFATAANPGTRCIELCFNVKDHAKSLPNENDVSIPVGRVIKGLDILKKLKEKESCDADGIIFGNGAGWMKSQGCLPALSKVKKFAMVGDKR